MQGVPLARRFALVPLGPPLLSYSSTAKVSRRAFLTQGICVGQTECVNPLSPGKLCGFLPRDPLDAKRYIFGTPGPIGFIDSRSAPGQHPCVWIEEGLLGCFGHEHTSLVNLHQEHNHRGLAQTAVF